MSTTSYVAASLAVDTFGLTVDSSSVTASSIYNASIAVSVMYPAATTDSCNITMDYSHNGRKNLNRWLSTGGDGLAINSGATTTGSLPGGVIYGAVSGMTDGGFSGFIMQWDASSLLANETNNDGALYMLGYRAHHEMSTIGKEFTKNFFGMNSTKLYSCYQAYSGGGPEGWSQVQSFGDEWDGAIIDAPAFRYGKQAIVNATIAACDPLDGKTDGVVSRIDLCKLNFKINSTIGFPYSCAAEASVAGFGKRQLASAATPAQNGTVSAQAVAVAAKIIDGLKDSQGHQAYLSYQPAVTFDDATTAYNSDTACLGAEWVVWYLELLDSPSFSSIALDNVIYDTLRNWVAEGWQRYENVLRTTWPDLTHF